MQRWAKERLNDNERSLNTQINKWKTKDCI